MLYLWNSLRRRRTPSVPAKRPGGREWVVLEFGEGEGEGVDGPREMSLVESSPP